MSGMAALPALAPRAPAHHGPRPPLRLVAGGKGRPLLPSPATRFRRRRLMALLAVTILVAAIVLLANAAVAGIVGGGDAAPIADATAQPAAAVGVVYVVQPGDTLWTIAAQIAPGADRRATVDKLVHLNGTAALEVGDRLRLS
jgi:hypothetical protein